MLINKILDDNYMDLLVENSLGIAFESPENTTWINNRFSVAHIPVSRFNMCLLGGISLSYISYSLHIGFSNQPNKKQRNRGAE